MSKVNNSVKKNGSKIKKKDNKGFTLVELLATLAVLSIIFTIVIYFALNIIGNSKGKSYKVTINNIERNAGNYVTENNDMLLWRDSSVLGYEYQCITVEHLIEKGYFDSDVLESNVTENEKVRKENYIYLERDKKTKTINKKILLYDGLGLSGLCTNVDTKGNISFEVKPIGKVVNGYSIGKDITIYYKLYNVGDSVNNYTYEYDYNNDDEDIIKGNFETISLQKKKEVKTNGTLNAWINNNADENIFNNSINIKTIDSVGPIIKLKENNTEHQIVRKTVNIPIVVTDGESGVNADSFTEDDIKVTIGGVEITDIKLEKENGSDNEVNYNLTINDLLHKGEVIITIVKDKVYDNLDNINIDTVLKPKVSFTNEYTVTYYLGNGTTTEGVTRYGSQTCIYNESCTLNPWSTYNKNFRNSDNGWIFAHWNKEKPDDATVNRIEKSYNDKETFTYKLTEDLNLYAVGKRNFNFYSGTNGIKTGDTKIQYWNPYSIDSSQYTSIDVPVANEITGWTVVGFRGNNVASSTYAVASGKTGYKPKPNELTSFDFRAIYKRTLTIKYDANGGTGTTNNTTNTQYFNSGVNGNGANVSTPSFILEKNGFERIGYTFSKWCETKTGGGTCTNAVGTYTAWSPSVSTTTVSKTLYANWTANTYTITYDLGGGTVNKANPTSYNIETSSFTLNNPTKTGYKFAGWTGSNGTIAQTSVTINKGSTGNKKYTANWTANTYTITYDLGGGTVNKANPTSYNIETSSFTLNNPTKTGYKFAGWTGSNGTTAQTSVTINKGSTGNKKYTANWKANTYTITYNLDGGTVKTANPTSYNVETSSFTLNNPTKTGYKFAGWTGSNGTTAQTSVTINKGSTGNKEYTANWTAVSYKVKIKYNVSGGTVKSSTTADDGTVYKWTVDSDGIISRNGTVLTTSITFGEKTGSSGLVNWDNSKYLHITKLGYIGKSNSEWKCLSGCTTSDKIFADNVVYSASDFCDASSGDCTVVLGVNWGTVTKYVNAKSGLNCRSTPSSANSNNIVSGKAKSCGSSVTGAVVSGTSWFYNNANGCYYSDDYLVSSKSSVTKCSSGSSGGGGTSCSISSDACGTYCNNNRPGTVGRNPGATSCYCCPSNYYVADPTTSSSCFFGWSC